MMDVTALFAALSDPAAEKDPAVMDVNGDGKVNNKDLTRLQKYQKGDEVEVMELNLDVNGDGKGNNKDITRLQKYLKDDEVELN